MAVDGTILGELDERSAQVLQALEEDPDITMQFALTFSSAKISARSKADSPKLKPALSLHVILYGPEWLSDQVGTFLQDCEIYLQEPHYCNRNVRYCNPHCLVASDEEPWMTFDLLPSRSEVAVSQITRSDALDALVSAKPLGELDSPAALSTRLLPHQRQALYFMTQRESGWDLSGSSGYRNNITAEVQLCAPEPFRGGILADSMGLGKSCSIIALLVHDIGRSKSLQSIQNSSTAIPGAYEAHTTLLIVPPALLQTWEDQLQSTFKAICSLSARARWAVTGTPLQNRLGDIATMCQFLRVYPYGDRESFHRDIISPWKAGHHNVAITRLRAILQSILLRRSQGSVQLPARTDLRFTLQLSLAEREHYSVVEANVARSIDEALHSATQSAKLFVNIIQQINELRLICDLGVHRRSTTSKIEAYSDSNAWDTNIAQRVMNAVTANESPVCKSCGLTLDAMGNTDDLGVDLAFVSSRVWLFSCLAIICERCVSQRSKVSCGCTYRCPNTMVTWAPGKIESGASSPMRHSPDPHGDELPTKISSLVTDLLKQPPGTKSIVFTFWSSALDLAAKGLSEASIMYTRYDGNISPANRSLALKNFRQDPAISVILMTISCAAVGLDITAASRAYILEPQWNPTVEEQALARVHRMGQTKEVTTIRFVMADTFEERVVETQERKKELAELLLSPEQHAESEHSLDQLRYFRSLLK
ncbi:DNA repair protein rad5 [Paraphoma chrysanthemicola]|uniref:DNA repair protein rad5 n=1 Tax=Paraphoma chrysanthemicola TaxID=798071 RepID=A0A8K0RDA3_9PLEO|nr:DNA repair protein rad5 [Paraphoma chrysanthemicola]